MSTWGIRNDIDPVVRPDVIGDAWLAPFRQDAVDVVILDPPYTNIHVQEKTALLRQAAYVARESVYWLHTIWISADREYLLNRAWLIRVGDNCYVRCLQEFTVTPAAKVIPVPLCDRGPALRYKRWLDGQMRLPVETV